MSRYIGNVSAYAYAVEKGYTGTEEEFALLMASYANVGQRAVEAAQTAITKASEASQSATTAINKASEATTAAQTATNKAAEAQTSAQTASTKASEASTAAAAAQTAKIQTERSASQALTDIAAARSGAISAVQTEGVTQTANVTAQALAAATSATTASTKASEASASATSAGQSATNAAASATSAAQSASDAQDVLDSIPADYSDLSANVSQLQADLGDVRSAFGNIAIEWIEGKYINGDGAEESYSRYACTQFIPVYGTTASLRTRIISNATYYAIAFYDANQTYIPGSGVINPSSSSQTFEGDVAIPNGAKYARCSCIKADVSGYFVFKLYDFIGNFAPQIVSDGAKIENVESNLENFKITEITYSPVELNLITGKYVYVGANSSNSDGTIQNSNSKAYMTVPVVAGDAVKVSGFAQPNAPILTFYSDTAINHDNYMGAYEVLAANKRYTDELIMIPDNCVMVAVSFSQYSTNTNVIKKSTATERVNQLWNAGYVKSSQISEYIANNPLQYRGRQACVFDNILCIGDSLTQGGENDPPNITPDEANASRTVTDEQYSYPTYLTKLWGCETTNWGISGQTSVSWLDRKSSSDWTGHDCAVVFLGSNDLNISDNVETCISTNNTTLRAIISRFKSDNVGAPVFICTLFKGWNDANGVSEGVVNNIRTIAAELPGVYLIDFRAYSEIKLPSVYTNTHPVAIGYEKIAEEIGGAISWYIKNYPDDFRWLRWVGTNKAVPITS